MQQDHRLAQIVDALKTTFDVLKDDTATSGFPIQVPIVEKKYFHYSELEIQERRAKRAAFPALMLNFGENGSRVPGGASAQYASLGQTEDNQQFALIAVLKETEYATDDLTDQVSNMIYSVERIVNGAHDLGVEGVAEVSINEIPQTSAGRAAAVSGQELEIIVFTITVTHVYRATNFA